MRRLISVSGTLLFCAPLLAQVPKPSERTTVSPDINGTPRLTVRTPNSRIIPPTGCLAGQLLQWTGKRWDCTTVSRSQSRPNTSPSTAAAGNSAPANAPYLIRTAVGTLSNAQVMGSLASGIVINTTTTGVQTIYPGKVCPAGSAVTGLGAAGDLTCNPFEGGTGTANFLAVWTAANTLGPSTAAMNATTGQLNFMPKAGVDAPAFEAAPSIASPTAPVFRVYADAAKSKPALWTDASSGNLHFAGQQLNLGGNTLVGTGAVPALILGANGPSWTRGTGAPFGGCVSGSLYSDTAGGSGSTLYVCEAGAWAAK